MLECCDEITVESQEVVGRADLGPDEAPERSSDSDHSSRRESPRWFAREDEQVRFVGIRIAEREEVSAKHVFDFAAHSNLTAEVVVGRTRDRRRLDWNPCAARLRHICGIRTRYSDQQISSCCTAQRGWSAGLDAHSERTKSRIGWTDACTFFETPDARTRPGPESARPTMPDQVKERQQPLQSRFRTHAQEALVIDFARATGEDPGDPFRGRVHADKAPGAWPYGIHEKVGGFSDAPTSGDILCAALASCLESTLRMIAARLDLTLESLSVEVKAEVDVRGALLVNPEVPVGFLRMDCRAQVRGTAGSDPTRLELLCRAAEHSCIVLQTLRQGVPVATNMTCTSE